MRQHGSSKNAHYTLPALACEAEGIKLWPLHRPVKSGHILCVLNLKVQADDVTHQSHPAPFSMALTRA